MNQPIRPIAIAREGQVRVFVGSAWQCMDIAAAETLYSHLARAIEQAKQQEALKA